MASVLRQALPNKSKQNQKGPSNNYNNNNNNIRFGSVNYCTNIVGP